MGKVKEKHLHKRTIPTIKYLPFAANNQDVTLPKEHITSNFCNQHFSVGGLYLRSNLPYT